MGTQQGLVAGRAGHHDLDGAFLGVLIVPFGAQSDDLVVEMDADVAAHADHHGLAGLGLAALLEVGDQVSRHAGDAGLGADHLLQRGPAALELGLLAVFLVLRQFVDLGVDVGQFILQPQLGEPRLVVNGHGGAVFPRLLHVVDVDVVAEHGAGVAVFAGHRGAGEGHEGGVGERIAQVLGVADLVPLDRGGRWGEGHAVRGEFA
ncbi:hypothetical protein D3C87_1458960 [compost metagenome]